MVCLRRVWGIGCHAEVEQILPATMTSVKAFLVYEQLSRVPAGHRCSGMKGCGLYPDPG